MVTGEFLQSPKGFSAIGPSAMDSVARYDVLRMVGSGNVST